METRWGGTIIEVSLDGTNFVNHGGNFNGIQPALYDGAQQYSSCGGTPSSYGWSPRLGGDVYGHGSPVSAQTLGAASVYTKSEPYETCPDGKGGGPNSPVTSDVLVEQTVTPISGYPLGFQVHYKLTHLGTDTHYNTSQEFPAVYANLGYDSLTYYAGTTPWTNGGVTQTGFPLPQSANPNLYASEQWAAYVSSSNIGLTIFTPGQYPYMGGAKNPGTSGETGTGSNYYRALSPMTIGPGAIIEGDVYLFPGSYSAARTEIYSLHQQLPPANIFMPFGNIDSPQPNQSISGAFAVSGWTFDNATVSKVEVLADGNLYLPAIYAMPRPDVASAYPNAPSKIGFGINVRTTDLANGLHTIGVRVTDASKNFALFPPIPVTVSNPIPPPTGPVASIHLSAASTSLKVGDVVQLTATAADSLGNPVFPQFAWSSSNNALLKVAPTGIAMALAPGAASIQVSAGGQTASLSFSVTSTSISTGSVQVSVGPKEIVFDSSIDSCLSGDAPDVPAHVVRLPDGSLLFDAGNPLYWFMSYGPDFYSLRRNCFPVLTSTDDWNPQSFKNLEWIHSLYMQGGTIHALIHNEYHDPYASNCLPGVTNDGNPCWYNSITDTSSIDNGHTFTELPSPQNVIAPPPIRWNPAWPQGPPPPYGSFSPSNIVHAQDGYYYALFMGQDTSPSQGACAMRTTNLSDPSSWRAWDGTGFNLQMTDPYTNPPTVRCAYVNNDIHAVTLGFDTYLNEYISVGASAVGPADNPTQCGFYFALSSDFVHWTPQQLLLQTYIAEPPGCQVPGAGSFAGANAYGSIIDHDDPTVNFETPGRTPYLYYTHFNNPDPSTDRYLIRVPLLFTVQDYALNVSNPTVGVFPGQAGVFKGVLTSIDNFSNNVNLGCISAPIACNFASSASLVPTANGTGFTTTLNTTASMAAQDYAFSVQGIGTDSFTRTHSQSATLRVVDYALGPLSSASISVAQGNPSAPVAFDVSGLGSFSSTVGLSCSGLPAGAACVFSPGSIVSPRAGSPVHIVLVINTGTASVGGPATVTISGLAPGDPRPAKTLTIQLTITNGGGASADLSAAIAPLNSIPNAAVLAGANVFHAVLTNNGPSGPVAASLSVVFPANISIGTLPSGCLAGPSLTVTCAANSVPIGSPVSFDIPVTLPFVRSVAVSAVASSTAVDPKPGNNFSSNTVQIRLRPWVRRALPARLP